MLVRLDLPALRRVAPHEYLSRFLLGGAITAVAGLIAEHFGPVVGGLFLAFPAIFPASATLLEKHERQKKRCEGISHTLRGRLAAAIDARGAALGAIALAAFAVIVCKWIPLGRPSVVLASALAVWLALATLLWRLRRVHGLRAAEHRRVWRKT